ncbi:MAG: methylmalonyl-CoA mutase family protein, partial [Candidatus Kapaibacterium sp.]
LEAGFIQEEIARSAYEFQKKVETKEEIVVGVNQFTESENEEPITLKIDPNLESDQIARVRAIRQMRENRKTTTALSEVERAAKEGSNLMPHILTAIESHATLGEISDVMRKVFGEYV